MDYLSKHAAHVFIALSRVALGDIDRARQIFAEVVASSSNLILDFISEQELYSAAEVTDLLIKLLAVANMPQGMSA